MMYLQTDLDLNKAWEITPYSPYAYGGIIILLCLVIYFLKREYDDVKDFVKEQQKYIMDQNIRIHSMAEEAISKFGEVKQDREIKHEKVITTLEYIVEIIKDLDKTRIRNKTR